LYCIKVEDGYESDLEYLEKLEENEQYLDLYKRIKTEELGEVEGLKRRAQESKEVLYVCVCIYVFVCLYI
jgi:amino acid permease